jgi:hypothetical protein
MRIAGTASALAFAALLACPTLAQAAPQFTSMNVALYSLDRGKPADARLELSIGPAAGGPAVAYLDLQGEEFLPYKTVQEVVPAAGTSFGLDELSHELIRVKVTPGTAYVSWSFGFDVILHFDDGSEALLGSGTLSVSSGSPEAAVPLSVASVAHPSFLGGMKKLGFKLLSKDPGSAQAPPSASFSSPGAVRGDPKAFTHMDLALTTIGNGKDASTRVEISILPDSGGPAVAYLDVQEQGFAPDSTIPLVVPPAGNGFTLGELKHEQILVKATQAGYGTWSCKFDAILHFADGTQALLGSGDLVLSSGNPQQAVPLTVASVAGPGFFGGMAKLGFKLVSKGSVTQTAPPPPATPSSPSSPGKASATVAESPAPKSPRGARDFTHMDVKIRSADRGKAADTGVEITIVPRGGGPALADLNLQGQEIPANSNVTVDVPATPWTSFTAADLKRVQMVVKISPAGPTTWIHGFDVVLHFADGGAALWSTGDLSLSDYNKEETIPLSDATIAKRGLFGGVEKFGFGLLNKIGK